MTNKGNKEQQGGRETNEPDAREERRNGAKTARVWCINSDACYTLDKNKQHCQPLYKERKTRMGLNKGEHRNDGIGCTNRI